MASARDGQIIDLDGVVRTFGDVTALAGVDLHVAAGEVVGLLGHNGAGKTTTVRVIAGLLPADAGAVRVQGLDPMANGREVRRLLGVLPARPPVDDRLSARQNMRFAADVFGVAATGLATRIDELLELFELGDRADERVGGFSTGMRQRLSLARILLPDPSILLLDEPTSALDPVAARQVRRLLSSFAQDRRRTVVLCTHDLTEAEQLCDRVVVLEHGRVVADGAPSELAAQHGGAGVRIEVDPADESATASIAGSVVGVQPVRDRAGLLRLQPAPRDVVPRLLGELTAAGIAVYELRRLEPSLEDVYLAIHGRSEPGAVGPSASASERALHAEGRS